MAASGFLEAFRPGPRLLDAGWRLRPSRPGRDRGSFELIGSRGARLSARFGAFGL